MHYKQEVQLPLLIVRLVTICPDSLSFGITMMETLTRNILIIQENLRDMGQCI